MENMMAQEEGCLTASENMKSGSIREFTGETTLVKGETFPKLMRKGTLGLFFP